jgi:hypothetical protein
MAKMLNAGFWFKFFENIHHITSCALWHRSVVQVHLLTCSILVVFVSDRPRCSGLSFVNFLVSVAFAVTELKLAVLQPIPDAIIPT